MAYPYMRNITLAGETLELAPLIVLTISLSLLGCSSPKAKKVNDLDIYKSCKHDNNCTIVTSSKCKVAHAANEEFAEEYTQYLDRFYEKMSCEKIPQLKKLQSICYKDRCKLYE